MTLWALTVGSDLQIHFGDIIATVTCALLLWMANRLYRLIAAFFARMHDYLERVDDHGERLDRTEKMVDRHSRALMKWEPLGVDVEQLYRGRRAGDAQEI